MLGAVGMRYHHARVTAERYSHPRRAQRPPGVGFRPVRRLLGGDNLTGRFYCQSVRLQLPVVGDSSERVSSAESQCRTLSANCALSGASGEFIPIVRCVGPESCAVNMPASPKTAALPRPTCSPFLCPVLLKRTYPGSAARNLEDPDRVLRPKIGKLMRH